MNVASVVGPPEKCIVRPFRFADWTLGEMPPRLPLRVSVRLGRCFQTAAYTGVPS